MFIGFMKIIWKLLFFFDFLPLPESVAPTPVATSHIWHVQSLDQMAKAALLHSSWHAWCNLGDWHRVLGGPAPPNSLDYHLWPVQISLARRRLHRNCSRRREDRDAPLGPASGTCWCTWRSCPLLCCDPDAAGLAPIVRRSFSAQRANYFC